MKIIPDQQCLSNEPPCEWAQDGELSTLLEVLYTIPDGTRLADFPSHYEGADCWCRPRVDVVLGMIHHKNLAEGQFDS